MTELKLAETSRLMLLEARRWRDGMADDVELMAYFEGVLDTIAELAATSATPP